MTYKLHLGDCLDVLRTLPANSVDTVITDPPYGLSFMGKAWDHGVPGVSFWREVLRGAKPGAMLLAFGGTRTFHRLACAIEDAGWHVRDCLMWLYAGGFPKSHDISKAIDKAAGAQREVVGAISRPPFGYEDRPWKHANNANDVAVTLPATDAAKDWHGWGTALKPAWEPIILAMKPLDGTFAQNAQVWGAAGLNIDGARIPITDGATMARNNKPGANGWKNSSGGPNAAALNGEPAGRWPANVLLDEDVAAGAAWSRFFYVAKSSRAERNAGLEDMPQVAVSIGDERPSGGSWERRGDGKAGGLQANTHPTVKPLALMRYLCCLTATPTGGAVLDPFMGSGTTGVACRMEGRNFIGVELDPQYYAIAERRIANARPPLLLPDVPAAPEPEQAAMFGD